MRHKAGTLTRRLVAAGVLAALGVVATALPSYAPHVAQMQVTPTTAKPGDQVTVYGPAGYGATNPVQVRWDAVDGPVLGEFRTRGTGFAAWGPETIRIPEDAKPGIHVLWVTQKLEPTETIIRGVPVRTVIQISDRNGVVPVVGEPAFQIEPREGALVEEKGVSGGTLLLVGLGAAGVALFLAGVGAILASRRRAETAEAVTTK